ncbi:MAG: 30S ribosomal protein S9 [Candidatus Micrarchaeaceae archaeon]
MANETSETIQINAAEAAEQAASKPAVQVQQKKVARRRPVKKKVLVASSRRKEARARARITQGTGRLTINGMSADKIQNKYLRELVLEPILLSQITKEIARNANIAVNVKGGGVSGQMQAARSAIAKAITSYSKDEIVKKMYLSYDRSLLVDDVRQVEPKKFKGPKARARFQKSYR